MELGHHIDTLGGLGWYRCQWVELAAERVRWELNPKSRYALAEAYERAPHRQLIRAVDDKALLVFMRAWGPPLAMYLPMWSDECPLARVRGVRDRLTAWVRLFVSIEKSDDPRNALLDLLRVDSELDLVWISSRLRLPSNANAGLSVELEARLANASQAQIDDICDFLAGAFAVPLLGNSLIVERMRKRRQVRATIRFLNLNDALFWMVQQDIFREQPFSFCAECGKLIQSHTRHQRRFCDDPKSNCARRFTDREWKKNKRADEKKRRLLKSGQARRTVKGGKA